MIPNERMVAIKNITSPVTRLQVIRPGDSRHSHTQLTLRLGILRAFLAAHLLISVRLAEATEYFVDFSGTPGSTCSDTNLGTSRTAPWCTLPGTRNTADTAYLNTAWGNVNGTAKIGAGDTIWIKGGTTMTSARGGRVHFSRWGGKSFYAAGTSGSPKHVRNGVDASPAWGSGDVVYNCSGMTIDVNPGYGCWNVMNDSGEGDWLYVQGSSDSARIRITNSASYGFSASIFGGSPILNGLLVQYVEIDHSSAYGINADNTNSASFLNVVTHDNGMSGAVFGGYGNDPCTDCSMVDVESYSNGVPANGGNNHGVDAINSGTADHPVVFLRCKAHDNGRDGFDNGIVTTSGVIHLLILHSESYSNGEDGFACSGDPNCASCDVNCSVVNSIAWKNADVMVAYETGAIMRFTNGIGHATGESGGVGCVAVSGPVDISFNNSICYKTAAGNSGAWSQGGGATGNPLRHSTNSIYIPLAADSEPLIYGGPAGGYDYAGSPATNPGGLFTTWVGNLLGISSPNNDSPPLFTAVSTTTYAANNYYPSASTAKSVDAGAPYCKVTSGTGSGTTFTTDCDPRLYFFSNANRPGIAADTAYVGTGTSTCTVASLTANSITCSSATSWAQGDSVARIRQVGSAPDIGVFEFSGASPPAPNLISVNVAP